MKANVCLLLTAYCLLASLPLNAASFLAPGDIVRVAKGDMLQFQGKNMVQAAKGQEFTVLQYQPMQNVAFVAYYKEDGSLVAVSIPANALQTPNLPDWAIVDLRTPPSAKWPGLVVDAGFFDEAWSLPK